MAAELGLDPTSSTGGTGGTGATGRSPVAGRPRASIPAGPSLVELLERHGPAEGANRTALPWLHVQRAIRPRPRVAVVSQPSVCIVAQGSKEAYLGGETYRYDSLHYLVLSVPLPIEARIVEASPERPYLALRIEVDPVMLGELLFDFGAVGAVGTLGVEGAEAGADGAGRQARRGIFVSRLDERLQGAVIRLLETLDHPLDPRILGRERIREVLYHVLCGDQGDLLRSVAVAKSRTHRLAGVLRFLQTHYAEELDVPTLANQAGMSPTTFHHQFRQMTSSSPMQYLKTIRLHQALHRMLQGGLGAAEAAYEVGYGSPSQFSREFRRLFGASPRDEVRRLGVERGE
jgi:AraC-like DNA-binding protein